jgi:lysozyme family protein
MKENEQQVLSWILADEGGFAARPEEPGNAVNMGVTLDTFTDWRVNTKKMLKPIVDDLRNLTPEECGEIYRTMFFDHIEFDNLPSGVDYCVADAAIHSGVTGSIRFLQEALGFKYKTEYPKWTGHVVNGKLDHDTLWALKSADPENLIRELVHVRQLRQKAMLDRKQRLIAGFDRSLWRRGWTRRNQRVLELALGLLREHSP